MIHVCGMLRGHAGYCRCFICAKEYYVSKVLKFEKNSVYYDELNQGDEVLHFTGAVRKKLIIESITSDTQNKE